jgi:probable ribonuclease FAU-1
VTLFPVGSIVRLEHCKPWKVGCAISMTGVAKSFHDGVLVIERTFAPGGQYDSLGDEKLAGDHGIIEVIDGGWVLRRVYYRADGELIGELYNIQTPTQLLPGVVRYTDLEVDVVQHTEHRVKVVDEDDLANAVQIGGISPDLAEVAMTIARRLADLLQNGGDWRDADAEFRGAAV